MTVCVFARRPHRIKHQRGSRASHGSVRLLRRVRVILAPSYDKYPHGLYRASSCRQSKTRMKGCVHAYVVAGGGAHRARRQMLRSSSQTLSISFLSSPPGGRIERGSLPRADRRPSARSQISSSVQLYYKRRASPENTTSRPPQSDERVVAHLETEAGDRAELLLVLRPEDRREGRRVVPVSELAVEAARHAERRRVALGAVLERKRRPATSAPPAITGRAEAAAAGAYFCSGPNWAGRTGGSGIGSDSKDGMSVSSLRYSAELCIFVVTSTLEKRWAGGGGGGERQQRERTVVAGRTPCLT